MRGSRSDRAPPLWNALSALAADLVPLLLAGVERAAGLRLGGSLRCTLGGFSGSPTDELAEALAALGVQVESVGGLGEAQVGVDAGHDDAGVDGHDLDADEGDLGEHVDHQALVEDEVEDLGQVSPLAALHSTRTRPSTHRH